MISVGLARRLRDAGLRWDPVPGDRFVVADRDMDDEIFTLSEMTVDVHQHATGSVIGFNGTVEWALDSVAAQDTIWLPSETQLRERLGATFRGLSPGPAGWRVDLEVVGRATHTEHADAAEAYGLALLRLITGE